MSVSHVVPVQDLIEHLTPDDCFYECPCGPDVGVVDGGFVVTHHSLDGREVRPSGAFYSVTKFTWWQRYVVWYNVPNDEEMSIHCVPVSRHLFCRTALWWARRLAVQNGAEAGLC